jgi:hypothetical protein
VLSILKLKFNTNTIVVEESVFVKEVVSEGYDTRANELLLACENFVDLSHLIQPLRTERTSRVSE